MGKGIKIDNKNLISIVFMILIVELSIDSQIHIDIAFKKNSTIGYFQMNFFLLLVFYVVHH